MTSNVVLLTIDALRADHLSCYGYERATTPFIDSFAEDAMLFEHAYSTSSHTREAVPSLLTGLYPHEATADDFTRASDTVATHITDTHETGAFHSNPYVSRAYGYDKDFDAFDDDLRLGQHRVLALIQRALDKFVFNKGAYHARAEEINERSLSWLDSLSDDGPFFLWNHYMDVHGPYNPPDEYNEWGEPVSNSEAQDLYDRLSGNDEVTDDEVETARNLYDGEIAYTDAHVEALLSELDAQGYLDDAIVIVAADHGDLFGEYGQFAHPRFVYQELTRIPLLIRTPETDGVRVEKTCSLIDLLPTILDWVDADEASIPGESLLEPASIDPDRVVYSTARGLDDEQNLRRIAANRRERSFLLEYDLSNETVHNEQRVGKTSTDSLTDWDELRDHALSFLDTYSSSKRDTDTKEVGEEIERRLDALGYK